MKINCWCPETDTHFSIEMEEVHANFFLRIGKFTEHGELIRLSAEGQKQKEIRRNNRVEVNLARLGATNISMSLIGEDEFQEWSFELADWNGQFKAWIDDGLNARQEFNGAIIIQAPARKTSTGEFKTGWMVNWESGDWTHWEPRSGLSSMFSTAIHASHWVETTPPFAGVSVVNLTPHALDIMGQNGESRHISATIRIVNDARQTLMARCDTQETEATSPVPGITTTRTEFGEVYLGWFEFDPGSRQMKLASEKLPLPAPTTNTIFVVSGLVLSRCAGRKDIFAPGKAVRNPDGKIIGSQGLSAAPLREVQ